jgi:Xaa-Pro aminopeptidase
MKHLPLNPSIFTSNRKRFTEKMVKNALAIFNSNDEMPANGDSLYPFQQNSDLFWLSGILQEDTMVILYPDNPDPKFREVLVLVRPNEMKEKWDGKRLRAEEAKKYQGLKTLCGLILLKGCFSPGSTRLISYISIPTRTTASILMCPQGIIVSRRK